MPSGWNIALTCCNCAIVEQSASFTPREDTMTKTVFITGASSGFGAASARRFARDGWNIVATGRRADRLQELADEIGRERIAVAVFDMRDTEAMDAALAVLPEAFRGVD